MAHSFRALLYCSASVISIAMLSNTVKAQDIVLEGIVIQGETVERSVQESSTSTTVLTGEELDRSSSTNLYDALQNTPGVNSLFGEKGWVIRGVQQNGLGAAGGNGSLSVNTIVDGASLTSFQSTIFGPYSTWDMEQVEVLKGPQSTQQGRSAQSGAIILRSADPFHGAELKIRQDFESLKGYRSAAALNIPVIPDMVAVRIAGEKYQSDGFVRNINLDQDDYDPRDLQTFRGKVLFTPTDNMEFIYGYTSSKNSGGEDYVRLDSFPDRFSALDTEAFEGSEHKIHNLRGEWNINDVFTLKSETSKYDHDYLRFEDQSFTFTHVDDNISQEVKVSFNTDLIKGAFGVFYTDIDANNNINLEGFDIGVGAPLQADINVVDIKQNFAVFGEADVKLFESPWTLTAGARYDVEKYELKGARSATFGDPILDAFVLPLVQANQLGYLGDYDDEGDFKAFLPKLGLAYNWTPDIKSGFVVQTSYKPGGTSVNLAFGEAVDYDSEESINYEIYQRMKLWNGRLTVNANAFYTKYKDIQVAAQAGNLPSTDPFFSFDTITINAGEATTYGLEFAADAQVTDELKLSASYAFLRSEYKDFVYLGSDVSGNSFAYAPEHSFKVGAEYLFTSGLLRNFFVSGDLVYTGAQEGDIGNDPRLKIDAFTVVNAQAGYQGDTWSFELFSRNLFDKDYITSISPSTSLNGARTGEPRVIGVSVKAKF